MVGPVDDRENVQARVWVSALVRECVWVSERANKCRKVASGMERRELEGGGGRNRVRQPVRPTLREPDVWIFVAQKCCLSTAPPPPPPPPSSPSLPLQHGD